MAGEEAPKETPKPTVFLSWSGKKSALIASAFGELLTSVFGGKVATWQSTRDIKGIAPWRIEIQEAVQKADVAVLSLGSRSLSSKWLIYEAGAFFRQGKTFVLGCGVTDRALDRTPLRELQVWDACDAAKVGQLVASIGEIFGQDASEFDTQVQGGVASLSRWKQCGPPLPARIGRWQPLWRCLRASLSPRRAPRVGTPAASASAAGPITVLDRHAH